MVSRTRRPSTPKDKQDYINDYLQFLEIEATTINSYGSDGNVPAVRFGIKNTGQETLKKIEVVVYFLDRWPCEMPCNTACAALWAASEAALGPSADCRLIGCGRPSANATNAGKVFRIRFRSQPEQSALMRYAIISSRPPATRETICRCSRYCFQRQTNCRQWKVLLVQMPFWTY